MKGPGVFDAPAITADNNGVDVVAPGSGDTLTSYTDTSGAGSPTADLDFYWQDSGGDFQKEIVAFGGVN